MIDQYKVKDKKWEVEQKIYWTFLYPNKMKTFIFWATDVDSTVDLQLLWAWMKSFLGNKYKILSKDLCIFQHNSSNDLSKEILKEKSNFNNLSIFMPSVNWAEQ